MSATNEPLTEQRDCAVPLVYGFLRLDAQRSSNRHQALLGVLHTYCQAHELALALTFTEYGPSCDVRSAAFVGLLDTLVLSAIYGVVVPSHRHLGYGEVGTRRRQLIEQTGRRLMVVRGERRRFVRRPGVQEHRVLPTDSNSFTQIDADLFPAEMTQLCG